MRAAVLKEPGRLAVEDVPRPEPEPGEVLLRVRDCGICGSDLHAATHPVASLPPGTIMGHEFSGEIAALGAGVDGWRVGEPAVSLPYMACGTCAACRAGDALRCPTLRGIGLGMLPGAYAEYVRVHPASLLRIPDGVDFRTAALVEPLAVALHGIRLGGIGRDSACVVMGAGPIGLTVVCWCRALGATAVVSDPAEGRAALARRLGAAAAVDPRRESPADRLRAVTGRDAEVVVECVGVRGTITEAIGLACARGTVVVLGASMDPEEIMPLQALLKELTLRFGLAYSRDEFAETLAALESGRIDTSGLVTDVVGIADVPDAFSALLRPNTQGKVLIEFP
jgi:(R,R)-butanediol dehydrogenase / meso-butanediol dehydrogenase / diacetyl reductase